MRLLTEISDDYKQQFQVTTEDNKVFTLSLEYMPNQQSWFFSLAYNNFSLNGQRLVLDPSLLRRFIAYLPFGMACICDDPQVDPFLLDDFKSGRIKLYTMTLDEVTQLEKTLYEI